MNSLNHRYCPAAMTILQFAQRIKALSIGGSLSIDLGRKLSEALLLADVALSLLDDSCSWVVSPVPVAGSREQVSFSNRGKVKVIVDKF
jgi:hypothetical protein